MKVIVRGGGGKREWMERKIGKIKEREEKRMDDKLREKKVIGLKKSRFREVNSLRKEEDRGKNRKG